MALCGDRNCLGSRKRWSFPHSVFVGSLRTWDKGRFRFVIQVDGRAGYPLGPSPSRRAPICRQNPSRCRAARDESDWLWIGRRDTQGQRNDIPGVSLVVVRRNENSEQKFKGIKEFKECTRFQSVGWPPRPWHSSLRDPERGDGRRGHPTQKIRGSKIKGIKERSAVWCDCWNRSAFQRRHLTCEYRRGYGLESDCT
ncbi:MAG: hypothetical protein JWN70_2239 [Planctomycetaceae bacterium]|nr:hypothetical protein [Planctomycetaceae bacterium]